MTVLILANLTASFAGALLGFWVFGGAYREHRRDRKRIARIFREIPSKGAHVISTRMDPNFDPPSTSLNPDAAVALDDVRRHKTISEAAIRERAEAIADCADLRARLKATSDAYNENANDLADARTVIERVRELHQPAEIRVVARSQSDETEWHDVADAEPEIRCSCTGNGMHPYPCPTVIALDTPAVFGEPA